MCVCFVCMFSAWAQDLMLLTARIPEPNNSPDGMNISVGGISEVAEESETKDYLWEFWSFIPENFDNPKYIDVDVGVFGKEIACLNYMFETSYVTREKPIPGDPTERTVIKKQSVYNATRNIDKYFKKEVKNAQADKNRIIQDYAHVLKVAIALLDNENTESFETELANQKKDLKAQIDVFGKVKLNNIY